MAIFVNKIYVRQNVWQTNTTERQKLVGGFGVSVKIKD